MRAHAPAWAPSPPGRAAALAAGPRQRNLEQVDAAQRQQLAAATAAAPPRSPGSRPAAAIASADVTASRE
jgi:hypothetical protein